MQRHLNYALSAVLAYNGAKMPAAAERGRRRSQPATKRDWSAETSAQMTGFAGGTTECRQRQSGDYVTESESSLQPDFVRAREAVTPDPDLTAANWLIKDISDCAVEIPRREPPKEGETYGPTRVLHADETVVNVVKSDKTNHYMWVYCSGTDTIHPNNSQPNIVLFDYQPGRSASCVINYLSGYSGYLQVDGYPAYGKTAATLVGCWAHARRQFMDAKKVQGKHKTGKADVALTLIQKLYAVEAEIKEKSPPPINGERGKHEVNRY